VDILQEPVYGHEQSPGKSNEQSAERDAEETSMNRNIQVLASQKQSESEQLLAREIWSRSIEILEGPAKSIRA